MAVKEGMSGIDLAAVVAELKELMPLWMGKIYQFDARTLGMRLNGKEGRRLQLLIETDRRIHLVGQLPEPPKNPTGFAMLLRKHLTGGKLLDIRQPGIQRILIIEVGRKDTIFRLCIEMFGEGNAILCDCAGRIIMPLVHQQFRERVLTPGESYSLPSGTDCLSLGGDELGALLLGSEREIVKVLATDCMLGGQYAEVLCRRMGIEKRTPAREVNPEVLMSAIQVLYDDATSRRGPVITKSGCWPFPPPGEEVLERFTDFSSALERYYGASAQVRGGDGGGSQKEGAIRARQLRAIAKFEEEIARLQRCVDAIYEHYQIVEEIIRVLGEASQKHSWEEIRSILDSSGHPLAGKIRAYFPDESAVELDLGERVKIHVRESLQENASRYYEAIKRLKKKREGARAAMARPLGEERRPRREVVRQKAKWYHRFRWFYTSDGALVIAGKDADQNEEIVKKYLERGDLFLHADVHGASVTVLKGGSGALEEAAAFAAAYSGAWKSGYLTADVYAVVSRQVSKTPPSGEYIGKGGFMIRGERRYFRNIPLALAIGVQTEPEFSVIGGPPMVISKRARVWVELRPGRFESNDATKKVLRVLRQRLMESGLGEYARLVRSEDIAGFVPPGGSEILGDHEGRIP